MGLPFDWHLRPKRITQLTSSTALRPPETPMTGLARLSSLRPSMLGIRNSLRRFSMHPVSAHPWMWSLPDFCLLPEACPLCAAHRQVLIALWLAHCFLASELSCCSAQAKCACQR